MKVGESKWMDFEEEDQGKGWRWGDGTRVGGAEDTRGGAQWNGGGRWRGAGGVVKSTYP